LKFHPHSCTRQKHFQTPQTPAKRLQHFNAAYCNTVEQNMLCKFGHPVAMCCSMLGVVSSSLKMVKFEPTTPNMRVETGRPMQVLRAQHLAPTMLY